MNLATAISYLHPTAEWSLAGNDYSTLIWNSPSNPPTLQELQAAWDSVSARKTWNTSAEFIEEFTLNELAAVQLSTNPTIAALRLILATWVKPIWSDDPRIQLGLSTMVSESIISSERQAEILS